MRLTTTAGARQPFDSLEERLLWYESLPYLNLSRAAERRLQGRLVMAALPECAASPFARDLPQAEALAGGGEPLQALQAITRVYNAGVTVFESVQQ